MILDGAKVTGLMKARRLDAFQVAAAMRRRGMPGTTAQWVRMVARGQWGDCPPPTAVVMALVLGCGLPEIASGPLLSLVRDAGSDLHR